MMGWFIWHYKLS